jgi:acetyl-CoA carboxylase biotin carboxylase subunit
VGGIKTNVSLFRRILRDADFRAAKLDTGFLDRMLKRTDDKPADSQTAEVAAIAAGVFAALGSTAQGAGYGAATSGSHAAEKADSNWKNASRREALR